MTKEEANKIVSRLFSSIADTFESSMREKILKTRDAVLAAYLDDTDFEIEAKELLIDLCNLFGVDDNAIVFREENVPALLPLVRYAKELLEKNEL
jgi:hypothetical protein